MLDKTILLLGPSLLPFYYVVNRVSVAMVILAPMQVVKMCYNWNEEALLTANGDWLL